MNAISYCQAVPHFIDSEYKTLGVDPLKLKIISWRLLKIREENCFNKLTGRRIKVVVAMHTFGHPVDLEPLVEVCKEFKLLLVEDAAESLGSYYKGKHVGNWGDLALLVLMGTR